MDRNSRFSYRIGGKKNSSAVFNDDMLVDVTDQVNIAREWLNSNRKEGIKAVDQAFRSLKNMSKNKYRNPLNIVVPTPTKSLAKLIIEVQSKKQESHCIFNENQHLKLLSQTMHNQQNQKQRATTSKTTQGYLRQLSKLENLIKHQSNQKKQKKSVKQHHSYSRNTSRDLMGEKNGDETIQQSHSKKPDISCLNSFREDENVVIVRDQKMKTRFHPFLENNLSMLYEPRKKMDKCWRLSMRRQKANLRT